VTDPPYKAETFHVVPRPDRFPGAITKKTTYHLPVAKGNKSRIVQGWFDVVRRSGNTALKGLKGTAGK
jgi:hypothetical protein